MAGTALPRHYLSGHPLHFALALGRPFLAKETLPDPVCGDIAFTAITVWYLVNWGNGRLFTGPGKQLQSTFLLTHIGLELDDKFVLHCQSKWATSTTKF